MKPVGPEKTDSKKKNDSSHGRRLSLVGGKLILNFLYLFHDYSVIEQVPWEVVKRLLLQMMLVEDDYPLLLHQLQKVVK